MDHTQPAELHEAPQTVARPFCTICSGNNSGIPVIHSHGMGVESTAITLRWLNEPESRDFCLCQLIVITAQTGDEHATDTATLVEKYLLPLYRKHKIRFVEVARAGPREADGIVVLQDTRSPNHLHLNGAYKLSDELLTNGTVPQSGGVHTCALKFKAFVVESWLRNYLCSPFQQAFGYNSDELQRATRALSNEEKRTARELRVAFGFNAEEPARAERALHCDDQVTMPFGQSAFADTTLTPTLSENTNFQRKSFFPLIDWQWTRQRCEEYIQQCLSILWVRSACTYCPFNSELSRATERGLARLRANPSGAQRALLIERISTAMNPRATVFARKSLHSILENAPGFQTILHEHQRYIAQLPWSIYRVRRIYSKKGKADRCVEVLETATNDEIATRFPKYEASATRIAHVHGITYAYLIERAETYPALEAYYVTAPAIVATKARYGIPWFDGKWESLLNQQSLSI